MLAAKAVTQKKLPGAIGNGAPNTTTDECTTFSRIMTAASKMSSARGMFRGMVAMWMMSGTVNV